MSRMIRFWWAGCGTLGLMLAAGCSTPSSGSGVAIPVPTTTGAAHRRQGEVFSETQIAETGASMLYDAIRRHRPLWLERRTLKTYRDPLYGFPAVYYERTYAGPIDKLREIPSATVAEVRYFSAGSARDFLGVFHPGGVIMIVGRHKKS